MLRALPPLLAITLLAFAEAAEQKKWNAFADRAFGKTYTSTLDINTVFQTPTWKGDTENPPISPRKAMKLAIEMCDSIAKAPEGWEWKPINLSLTGGAGDRWYWTVTLRADSSDEKDFEIHAIRLLVYMDGTVAKPSVSDTDPKKESQD